MTVDVDKYQLEASKSSNHALETKDARFVMTLGLAGESGEVAELVKKNLGYPDYPMSKSKLCAELGDLVWYVSELSRLYGIKLSEVFEMNLAKIKDRYPKGFPQVPANSGRVVD